VAQAPYFLELRAAELEVLVITLRALLTLMVLQVALVEVCLLTQITMKSATVVELLKHRKELLLV
jgi:hypothetical protein